MQSVRDIVVEVDSSTVHAAPPGRGTGLKKLLTWLFVEFWDQVMSPKGAFPALSGHLLVPSPAIAQ